MTVSSKQVLEDLKTKVYPKIQSLIEKRDFEKEKLARLQAALSQHEEREKTLQGEIRKLMDEVGDLIALGQDTTLALEEVRKKRDALVDTKEWLDKFSTEMIPAALKSSALTRKTLVDGTKDAIYPLRLAYNERCQRLVNEFLELVDSWDSAVQEFYGKRDIPIERFSSDQILSVVVEPEPHYVKTIMGLH